MSKEPANELETGDLGRTPSQISRKRSLVKPERRRLTKDDPNYFYTLATEEGNVSVHPSTTGTDPHITAHNTRLDPVQDEDDFNLTRGNSTLSRNRSVLSRKSSKRRSNQSKLTRDGSTRSKKSLNSQDRSGDNDDEVPLPVNHDLDDEEEWDYDEGPKLPFMPKERNFDPWQVYCKILTCFIPGFVLKVFGLNTPERQMAWREKIGLISVILLCGLFVGYLTFGFTQTVCSNSGTRIHAGNMQSNQLLINGFAYDFGSYDHPAVEGIDADSPILYPPVNAGGKDASFMFQNVNGYCKNVITPKEDTSIPHNSKGEMGWYFPCQLIDIGNFSLVDNEDLVTNGAELYDGWGCHSQDSSRTDFYSKKVTATIYYTWDDLWNNRSDPLISYNGDVLDLRYLDFLLKDDVDYPELFDKLRDDESIRGRDISQEMSYGDNRRAINCLREITKVGEIDTDTIGCIASKVVLYISLVFIMGLVVIKFLLACYFRFFISRRQGAFPISEAEFRGREQRIEDWGDDINAPGQQYQMFSPNMQEMQEMNTGNYAPSYAMSSSQFDQASIAQTDTNASSSYSHVVGAHPIHQRSQSSLRENPFEQPKRKSMFLDKLTNPHAESQRISGVTMSSQNPTSTLSKVVGGHSLQKQPLFRQSIHDRRNTMYEQYGGSSVGGNGSLIGEDISYHGAQPEEIEMQDLPGPGSVNWGNDSQSGVMTPTSFDTNSFAPTGPAGGTTEYLVPQPPLDFQPFGYPLAHVMCMVTAYSESVEGLRTTLDSICTTDYPNSHQLIAIVCDGLVKGSGNDMSTPEICLSMMTDFCQPVDEVKPYSYVSVVSGEKRHNMAKVYAGFYRYDDDTIPPENQQRVPMICIVKCGTPNEANSAKPGNRGKRDSQIILMSFLQRVMFDERMTELEFEIFNGIRSVTGVAPDFYEMLLMVDADTKVFPDCLTHMCAEMVRDPQIMGLCGETKIANKRDSWVTMIQVFEYFISHHQAKAFESVFGGVTCLPGCFSMYRIKAPKGEEGYWVPILCNPDIVERYSDNAINTLHSKNLLLLGEDRFLSTLMLRTFPKRKMMFVPKAACKTVVPDEFKVLLSQRRRWINSTIHNLFELLLVRDLCGVFIISMQFVVFVDLLSTLVLPAALAFTLYVVIIACVKKPVPYLSLILLGMILGLPGLLIVVTATRASYVLWMLVYLAALPVWNFVLPLYAYWKFDDFSWGETRSVEGGNKAHDEAKGEFDSSQIVMKRWREFQEDRLNEQRP